jgi:hypothetical protein
MPKNQTSIRKCGILIYKVISKFCKANYGLVEMALRKIMTRRLKTVDRILKYNKINLLKSPTRDDFSTKLELLQFQLWNNFLANFDKALIFCSTF